MVRIIALFFILSGCVAPVPIPPIRYQGIGTTTVAFSNNPASDCQQGNAVACTFGSVIIIPDPCIWSYEYYASLLCHENGHRFKGWKHEKEKQ